MIPELIRAELRDYMEFNWAVGTVDIIIRATAPHGTLISVALNATEPFSYTLEDQSFPELREYWVRRVGDETARHYGLKRRLTD